MKETHLKVEPHAFSICGALALVALMAFAPVFAGNDFYVRTFSSRVKSIDVTPQFAGILNRRFVTKYPGDRYQIVVISRSDLADDGTAVAAAFVGVSPSSKGNDVLLPAARFSRLEHRRGIAASNLRALETELVLLAATDMINECNASANCDLEMIE